MGAGVDPNLPVLPSKFMAGQGYLPTSTPYGNCLYLEELPEAAAEFDTGFHGGVGTTEITGRSLLQLKACCGPAENW